MDMEGIESYVRVALKGVDTIRSQFAALRKDAKSVETVNIEARVNLPEDLLDAKALRKAGAQVVRELRSELKELDKVKVDFTGIRQSLSKAFSADAVNAEVSAIERRFESAKTLINDNVRQVESTVRAMNGTVREVNNTLRATGNVDVLPQVQQRLTEARGGFDALTSGVKRNMAEMITASRNMSVNVEKDLSALLNSKTEAGLKATAARRLSSPLAVGMQFSTPLQPAQNLEAEVQKLAAVTEQAGATMQAALRPVEQSFQRIEQQAGKTAADVGMEFAAAVPEIEETGDEVQELTRDLLSFEQVAQGLAGGLHKLFDIAPSQLRNELNQLLTSLRSASTDTTFFESLFGPKVTARVQALQEEMTKLSKMRDALFSGAGEEESDEAPAADVIDPGTDRAKQLLAIEEQVNNVLRVRKEIADGYLAAEQQARMTLSDAAADAGSVYRGNAAAAEALVATTERHKSNIAGIISLMGEGGDIIKLQNSLYGDMVAIIKAGGDAEAAVIARELDRVEVQRRSLDYANRLLKSAQELANLPQSTTMLQARKSLLDESAKAYRATAMTADGSALADAIKGAASAEAAGDTISVMQQLRSVVIDTASTVEKGLAPAYDKVTAAVARYSSSAKGAFSGDMTDVQLVGHVLASLQQRLQTLDTLNTSGAREEMQALLRTIQQLNGAVSGATNDSQLAQFMQEQSAGAAASLKALQAEELREKAMARITEDYGKLIALQEAGVNAVGNAAKLEQLYITAIKEGVPIEEKLVRQTVFKADALRSLNTQYRNLVRAAEDASITEELRLTILKQANDTLKAAIPLQQALGRGVRSEGQNITRESLQTDMAGVTAQIAGIEREKALRGELRSAESASIQMSRERLNAENQILQVLRQSAQLTADGMVDYAAYTAAVKAHVDALRAGVDTSRTQADITQMASQAMAGLVKQEEILVALASNEEQSYLTRTTAARELLSIIQQMANATAKAGVALPGGGVLDSAAIAAKRAQAETLQKSLAAEMAAKAVTPTLSIADVVRTPVTEEVVTAKQSAEAERLAAAIGKARDELLSGVSVLENWNRLQQLAVDAATKGVSIDQQSLQLMLQREKVGEQLVAAAQRVAAVGLNSGVPAVAAAAFQQVDSYIKSIEKIAGADNALAGKMGIGPVDTTGVRQATGELDKLAESLRAAAGAEIAGSFARTQQEAATLARKLAEITASIHAANAASKALPEGVGEATTAYTRASGAVDRILGGLDQWKAKELEIARNAEFLAQADEQTVQSQFAKVRELERVIALLKKTRAEQEKFNSAMSRLGNFSFGDMLESGQAGKAARAATIANDNKTYVQATESARQMLSLNTELQRAIANSTTLNGVVGKLDGEFADAREELVKVNAEMSKFYRSQQNKASRAAGSSVFDMARIQWFAQLRMFWSMFIGVQEAISNTVQFTHTLNVMQAVTQSSATTMRNLTAEFFRVGQMAPIAIANITDATLSVAKAGFSAAESIGIVRSSARLAYATQSDMKKVADLQTVIMRAWDMSADKADDISDKLLNAVNKSRADIEGLDQAIGYVAGIAPQANVTLSQVLGMVSILTNSGLSMSKAGTYMRQFLNDLMNPSEKLVATLGRLGLAVSDIDPRMNKIGDIFKRLSAAGMTVSDAFDGMSVRAASAFSILLNNSDLIDEYTNAIDESGTTMEAFALTTKDVASGYQDMQNAMLEFANSLKTFFGPVLMDVMKGLSGLFRAMASGMNWITRLGDGMGSEFIPRFVAAAAAIGTVAIALRRLAMVFQAVQKGLAAVGLVNAAVGGGGLVAALAGLGTGPLLGIAAALAGIYAAFKLFDANVNSPLQEAATAAEVAKEAIDNLRAATNKEMELRLRVEEAKQTGSISAAAVQDVQDNYANTDTPGARYYMGVQMARVAEEFRKHSNETVQELGNQMTELVIRPDMDMSLATERWNTFMGLYKQGADQLAKAPEAYAENIDNANKKLETLNKNIDEGVARLQRLAAAGAKGKEQPSGAAATDAWRIGPDMSGIRASGIGAVSAEIEGQMNKIASGGSWWTPIKSLKSLHDAYREFREYAADNKIKLEMVGPDGEIKSWENDFFAITDFNEARDYLLARMKELSTDLGKVKLDGLNTEQLTAFRVTLEQQLAALQQVVSNTPGTEEGAQSLEGATQRLEALKAAIASAGLGGSTTLFAGINAQIETLQKNIAKATEDIQRRIRNTARTANADVNEVTAAASQVVDIQKIDKFTDSAKQFYEQAGKAKYGVELAKLIDTEDARMAVSKVVGDTEKQFAQLVSELTELAKDVPFEKMTKETQKQLGVAVKAMFEAKVAAEQLHGAMTPQKFVDIADSIRSIPGAEQLNVSEMLKMGEAGRQVLADLRNATKIGITDSLTDVQDIVRRTWATVGSATDGGFSDVFDALTEEAYKVTKTYLSARKDIVDAITGTKKAMDSFGSSTATTRHIVDAFGEVSAAAVELGKVESDIATANEEFEGVARSLRTVQDAAEEMDSVVSMFKGLADPPLEAKKAMESYAKTASSQLGTVESATEKVRSKIAQLTDQLVKLRLTTAKSDFDFIRTMRGTYSDLMSNEAAKFADQQANMNQRRSFIRENAPLMDTDALAGELKALQQELVAFFKANPYTSAGRNAEREAYSVQKALRDLSQVQQQRIEADIALQRTTFEHLMRTGEVIASTVGDIRDILSGMASNSGMSPLDAAKQAAGVASSTLGNTLAHLQGKSMLAAVEEARKARGNRGDKGVSDLRAGGLGALSAKYESNGSSATVGYDRKGGTSYGKYQLSSAAGTMGDFLTFLDSRDAKVATYLREAKAMHDDKTVGGKTTGWNTGSKDGSGPQAWKDAAARFGPTLTALEQEFITLTHYLPVVQAAIKAFGIDLSQAPKAIQDAVFSTAVQHGSARTNDFVKEALTASKGKLDESFLANLYSARMRPENFQSSAPDVRASVGKRLQSELADAINMLRAELASGKPGEAPASAASGPGATPSVDALASAITRAGNAAEQAIRPLESSANAVAPAAAGAAAAMDGLSGSLAAGTETLQQTRAAVDEAQANAKKLAELEAQARDRIVQSQLMVAKADASMEALTVDQSVEIYAAKFKSTNTLVQEAFEGLLNTASQGIARATTQALRDVAEGTGDAEDMLYELSWQMIDQWMNYLMQGAMQSMMDPSRFSFMDFLGLGEAPASQVGTLAEGAVDATGAATEASDAANRAALLAQEQGVVSQQQALVAQEQALVTQKQTQAAQDTSLFTQQQAILTQEQSNATANMTAAQAHQQAATSLSSSASSLNSAAQALASRADGGGGGAGGLIALLGGDSSAAHEGGLMIPGFDVGGLVINGSRERDSVVAALTKGEYVVQEPAVRTFGVSFFRKLNEGNVQAAMQALPGLGKNVDSTEAAGIGTRTAPTDRQASRQAPAAGGRQSLNIMNVMDPSVTERALTTHRSKRLITNVVHGEINRMQKG